LPAPRRNGPLAYVCRRWRWWRFSARWGGAHPWLGEGYASLVFVVGVSMVGALHGMAPALLSAAVLAGFRFLRVRTGVRTDDQPDRRYCPAGGFHALRGDFGLLSGRLRDEATRASRSTASWKACWR
jgi:two-component system sensor histidine kinase KdpD